MSIYEIKKGIGAVLFENSEASNKDIRLQMCPQETESLCKYQAGYQTNTTACKWKPGLPAANRELVRPIFIT